MISYFGSTSEKFGLRRLGLSNCLWFWSLGCCAILAGKLQLKSIVPLLVGGITPRFTIDISGTCFSSHGLVQAIYNQGPFQDPTIPIKQMREANQQLSMEFDQNLNGFKTWPRSNYDLVGMIIPNISQLG